MAKTLYLVWQVDSVDNEILMEVFDNEELAKLPKYYREIEHPEKYKKKSRVVIVNNKK